MSFTCVVIGEDTLTFQCADTLLERGHKVLALISRHRDAARWASKNEVRLLGSIIDIVDVAGETPFEYLFSIANLKMLPKEVVSLAQTCAINFHDGPLPRYAGIHATSWALINGESSHGISWHSIGDRVDGGLILKQRIVSVSDHETAFSLNAKCFEAGLESFPEHVGPAQCGRRRVRARRHVRRGRFAILRGLRRSGQ